MLLNNVCEKEGVLVPIIDIPDKVFDFIESALVTGTKINPTHIVRASLLLLYRSNLDKDQIFSLIGQSTTDSVLINSLKEKKE